MIASAQTLLHLKPIADMEPRTVAAGMTYGLGPAGYDIRLAQNVDLQPGEFILASAFEYFQLPNNLLGIVHDKSTLARRGLSVFNTVIEPGWRGYLTLELKNQSAQPINLCTGSPIAQVVFHLLDQPTDRPYVGRYQDQAAGPQAGTEISEPSLFEAI